MKKQKKLSKKNIYITLICLLIITIISLIIFKLFYHTKNTSTTSTNTNESQITETSINIEDKTINNILFSDIQYSYDGNYSLLTYKITNNSTETINLEEYEIIIKDKDNNIIANISTNITHEIKPTETIETGNAIDIDLKSMYTLELISSTE